MKTTIIIEHTSNFSARLIQFWMAVDALVHLKKPVFTYNHALIIVGNSVFEAVDNGVVQTGWEKHFNLHNPERWITYDTQLTEEESVIVLNYLYDQKGKPYELANFWWHIVKTFTGKWYGAKNDKKAYCYELVFNALNQLDRFDFDPYLNPREAKEAWDKVFNNKIVKLT